MVGGMVTAAELTELRDAVSTVADPEMPVLTIADLGVLRDVTVDGAGHVEVTITPTYSGCPAMDTIRDEIGRVLADRGHPDAVVRTALSPAWTTDWISEAGRGKLAGFGIAPPGRVCGAGPQKVDFVRCPRCASADTRLLSRFSSTACKALRACNACLEPFDHMKAL